MACAGSERPVTEASRSGETRGSVSNRRPSPLLCRPELRSLVFFGFLCSASFRLFDCCRNLFTPAVWHNVNPVLDHRVHFASLHASQRLLDYLQSSAVVLELWGLQGEDEKWGGGAKAVFTVNLHFEQNESEPKKKKKQHRKMFFFFGYPPVNAH